MHGGCNGLEKNIEFTNSNITGLAVGSLFHYNLAKKKKFKNYENTIGNFEYLNNYDSIYSDGEKKKYLTVSAYKKSLKKNFKIRTI